MDAFPRAVLFDLDETLCLTNAASEKAMRQVACSVVHEPAGSARLLAAWHSARTRFWGEPENAEWGRHAPERAREVCFEHAVRASMVELRHRYSDRHYVAVRAQALSLSIGSRQLLGELARRRIRVGIVTNGNLAEQVGKVEALQIKTLVNVVAAADDLLAPKPEPDLFLCALRALGIQPKEAVMIGDDEWTDGLGSLAAGVRFIHLSSGACVLQSSHPHAHLQSLLEATGDALAGLLGEK